MNDDKNQVITLDSTNGKAVRFSGRWLASVDSKWINGQEQNRWTHLAVYRTKAGKYVLWIEHNTQWQGEESTAIAHVCDSPEAIYSALLGEDDVNLGRLETELLHEVLKVDPAFEAVIIEDVE